MFVKHYRYDKFKKQVTCSDFERYFIIEYNCEVPERPSPRAKVGITADERASTASRRRNVVYLGRGKRRRANRGREKADLKDIQKKKKHHSLFAENYEDFVITRHCNDRKSH